MKKLFISSVIAPLSVSFALGQVAEPKMDAKLGRYHSALLKRPESKTLFQKFQTGWLARNSEKSLDEFLKVAADKGGVADKQLYAYFLLQKGKEQEVIAVLTSALAVNKDNAQVYLDRANTYSRLLDFDRAVVDVNKALELGGDDGFLLSANKLKGRFLTRQGKTDEAVAHWKDLAKRNPNDQELIEDVIDILIADRLSPSALELAVKLRDNTKDPYKKALRTLRVGDILSKQGERDKALATYVDTLDLSGGGSWLEREIVGQIQMIFKKEENLNGLVEKFTELVKKYPQRVYIETKLAGVLVDLSRFDRAKKIYQSLLKKSPLDDSLRLSYFNMLKQSGDFITARKLIDDLIKRKPEDAQLHLQRAGLSHEMKVTNDVLNDLANYRKVAKASALIEVNYAAQLSKYDFKNEAITAYQSVVSAYPDSLDTALAAAQYLYANKKKDDAVAIWSGIADKVDGDGLLRLIETLAMNAQSKLAMDLVKSHYEKYRTSLPFLGAAVRIAELAKDDGLAVKYAFTQLLIAKKPLEIDQAISSASRIIIKTKKVDEKMKELSSKGKLSNAEKFLLADLQEFVGELGDSDKLLGELAESREPANLLQLTRVYERRYQLERAAAIMEELIRVPNQLKAIHLRRLNGIYQRAGKIDLALKTIQKWKTLSPNDKQVWLAEVDLLETVKGAEKALESLRKGAQKFEGDSEIFAKLAALNSASGRFSQARLLYWRLYDESESMSDRISWAAELAKNAQDQESMDMLIDELTKRRRNSPNSLVPIMALAEVYRVNDQSDERRNLLLEATRLRPDDASLLMQVASMDSIKGANKDAINILRKAQKLDKTGAATRKLASLLMDEGNYEEALEELENAAGSANVKVDARLVENLVMKLIKQDALEEAEAYLKKSLVKFPDDWRLFFLESVILYEQGYSKKAAEGALALFSKNNKLKNVTSGWKPRDDRNLQALVLNSDPIPEKYAQLGQLSQAHGVISSLTQSQNSGYYYGSRQNMSLLPLNLKSLRLLSSSLFFIALEDLGENDQKDLFVQAARVGIDEPELMRELYATLTDQRGNGLGGGRGRMGDIFLAKIKKNPENKEYYNLLVTSRLQQGNFLLPKEMLKKARALNASEKNSFISKCLGFFTAEELSDKERLDQILAMIQRDKDVEDFEIILLFMQNKKLANVFNPSGQSEKIDPRVLTVFKKYINKYKNVKMANPFLQLSANQNQALQMRAQMIFMTKQILRGELFRGDDYKAIIAEIEAEKSGVTSPFGAFGYGGYSGNNAQQPLTDSLTTVTQSQYFYFSDSSVNNNGFPRMGGGQNLDKKKTGQHLDAFKNPILKIVAAKYAVPETDVMPMLEAAKKNIKTRADAHLLHASILNKKGNSEVALIEQLNLALKHTVVKNQRTQINAAILRFGQQMSKEDFDKLDDKLKEGIRVTARRLMISRKITDAAQIQEIITKFSMEKEQARYLTKNKKAVRTPLARVGGAIGGLSGSNLRSSSSSSGSRKDPFEEKLKKAIGNKQLERATNLMYQKLRGVLKQSRNSSWELEKLAKHIKKFKLGSSLIEKMDPRDSTNPRKWLYYYELGNIIKDEKVKTKAIDYLSGLSVVPKRARVPIALAIYKTQKKKAIELLKGASGNAEQILGAFYNDLKKNTKDPEAYVSNLEFINHYISNLGDNASAELYSNYNVQQILEKCAQIQKSGMKNVNSQYTEIPKDKKELIKRRDAACRQFVISAMKSNQIADLAFRMFLKDFSTGDKYKDANIALAKESLINEAKLRNNPNMGMRFRSGSSSRSSKYDSIPDRDGYLAEAVVFRKDLKVLDDTFLKEIKANDENLYAKLVIYKKYLLASSEEIQKGIVGLKGSDELSDYLTWVSFLKAKSDVKAEVKLSECFFNYLKKARVNLNSFGSSNSNSIMGIKELITLSIGYLYQNNKQEIVLEYADAEMTRLFKNKKGQEISEWLTVISNYKHNPQSIQHLAVVSIMKNMLKTPITIADGVKFATKYRYPIGIENRFGSRYYKFPSRVYEKLLKMGYLNNPEKITLTKMPVFTENEMKNQKGVSNFGGSASGMRFLNKVNDKAVYYDVQYLARSYKSLSQYGSNSSEMDKLKSKLEKAPKEYQYGAALFLTLMEKKKFAIFVKEQKSTLKKAPKAHIAALRMMFDIDNSKKYQNALKHHNLDDLFSVDKEALEKEVKK